MVIVYESKTGFTRKYAEMLSAKTGMKVYSLKDFLRVAPKDDIIFLGWIKAGNIQGLNKVRRFNVKAVCATGTARHAEPSVEVVLARNKIENLPFFYLRGGCLPLKELKGLDKFMLSMFLKVLKARKDKDEETLEAIDHIENGYDGVKEENLKQVIEWINKA